MIVTPSRLRLIRKAAALARISPHFDFKHRERRAAKKRKLKNYFLFMKIKPHTHVGGEQSPENGHTLPENSCKDGYKNCQKLYPRPSFFYPQTRK